MRYHEGCRYLRTKNWQALFQSNITTLDALKSSAKSSCTFVAIDFEGVSTDRGEPLGLTDIGIAVLPFPRPIPTQPTLTPTRDTSSVQSQKLQTFYEQNAIECHWLRLKGRRLISGPKETCHFGQFQEIEPAQTEAALVTLLQSIQQRHNGPMVLAGFDLVFELKTIESHLSQVLQFFSSWVDLQDIIMEVSETKITYGLRDTLRAVGFTSDNIATAGRRTSHNPADDTVRELAVLVKLLELQEGITLQVEIRRRRGQHELRRYWYGHAPRPKELYPFTARVYIQGKRLSSVLPHFRQLAEMFEMYDPTAVGINTDGKYGWVSLSSMEGLTRFIQDVHGKELRGETWIVVSKYDPLVIPMTRIQLSNAKQAAQEAERERKQLERRLKREAVLD